MNKSRIMIIITSLLCIILVIGSVIYLTVKNNNENNVSMDITGYWKLYKIDVYENGNFSKSIEKDNVLLEFNDEIVNSVIKIDETVKNSNFYYFITENIMYYSKTYLSPEEFTTSTISFRNEYEVIGDKLSIVDGFNSTDMSNIYVFERITEAEYNSES